MVEKVFLNVRSSAHSVDWNPFVQKEVPRRGQRCSVRRVRERIRGRGKTERFHQNIQMPAESAETKGKGARVREQDLNILRGRVTEDLSEENKRRDCVGSRLDSIVGKRVSNRDPNRVFAS